MKNMWEFRTLTTFRLVKENLLNKRVKYYDGKQMIFSFTRYLFFVGGWGIKHLVG